MRDTGFYGTGTPKVAIYGPIERPFASSSAPWVERNAQPKHWSLPIPEGDDWDWCVALTLHPTMKFWCVLCDFKGPEKHDPDDIDEAPEELRDLIKRCRPHYYRRAVLSTAKLYEVDGLQRIGE